MHSVFLFFAIVQSVTCAKILAVGSTPPYSHQSVFRPLWQELSLRGHQVTLITTHPVKNPELTNLTEIDISFTHNLVYEVHQTQHLINTESNLLILFKHLFFILNNMTMEQLRHPQVEKVINGNDNFDLMILEAHTPAWFGLAKKFDCPIIIFTSMPSTNFFKRVMGNINNFVYTHTFNLPFDQNVSFLQRIICFFFELFDEIQNGYLLYYFQERIIQEAVGDPEIDLFRILNKVSLLISNEIPGFSKVVTTIPSVIQINGLQIKPPEELPSNLKSFLDEAPDGAIYFSLGSSVKSNLMPEKTKRMLLQVFEELPFKVVWKLEEELDNLPQNVKIVFWAPQQDILRHKNTKLFITQGGVQSIDESIRFKVPILGVPFMGDQIYNVIRIKDLRLGSWLDLQSLTKEKLKRVILETMNNSTYLKNLEEMSALMEHPLKSLDKTVWWIEYVLRYDGAYHLRSPLADIPFYQYYLLDVGAFLFVVVFMGLFISLRLTKVVWKFWQKMTCRKIKVQ